MDVLKLEFSKFLYDNEMDSPWNSFGKEFLGFRIILMIEQTRVLCCNIYLVSGSFPQKTGGNIVLST